MRKLKFHEKKLLKKVDFFNWKNEGNIHEIKVIRRYNLQDREDYTRYIIVLLSQIQQDMWFDYKIALKNKVT